MARLCLLLGFLCVVGCRATSTSVPTTMGTTAPPAPPASPAPPAPANPTDAPSSTAPDSDPVTSAATVTTTGSSNPVITTTIAVPSNAAASDKITTLSNTMAPSNPVASTTASQVIPTTGDLQSTATSSQQATTESAAIKADAPTMGQTTPQSSLTRTTQKEVVTSTPSSTTTPVKSDDGMTTPAKEESTTGPPLPSTAAQATKSSSASPAELKTTQPSPVTTESKDNQTPALSTSSASPVPGRVSFTPSSKIPESTITPKQTSGITSSVSANTDKSLVVGPVVKYGDNIEVQCKNGTGDKLVKIHLKASRICDNNITHTDDEHQAFMHVCQAVMPGYQHKKDKCTIQLGRTDSDEVPVIAAIVETQLNPEDLFAKLKGLKKRDYSTLFSYQSSALEDPDVVSIPLISAIVSLAVALLIIAAIYGCWHQKQTRKREQRLTEELQTMENGYHDNPTLEVMETAPEMQEKKGGPNGELGDSWIVPLDNLTGDELLDEEEDTHL